MGLWRSRATLSAFVPAQAGTGWLPGDGKKLGRTARVVKVLADGHHGTFFRTAGERLSAFVPAFADTGWLPGYSGESRTPKPAGQGCLRTASPSGRPPTRTAKFQSWNGSQAG